MTAFTPLTFQGEIPTNDSLARALIQLQTQISALGASSVSFGTIAVSGQSNVVAAIAADTLNIAAGSNITLTTTPGTNTVTIAAAGGSSGLTVGTTTIAGGATAHILYDNAGRLDEVAVSGTGLVAMTTSPSFTTPVLGTPTSGTLTNCTGLPAAGVVGTAAILGANTFTDLQTITQGSANAGIIASTGYSITGSNATSMVSLAGTINTSATTLDVVKLAVTVTAAGTGSNLLAIYGGGSATTKYFAVAKSGLITLGNSTTLTVGSTNYFAWNWQAGDQFVARSTGLLGWASGNDAQAALDTSLYRNAAGVVEINNGTAGTYRDLKLRNLIPGATLATNMTDGFYNICGAAGAPSGTPNNTTGFPMYWDSTNLQLYVYTGGAWKKSAAFT